MAKVKGEKKTVQLGLRVEEKLLKKIEMLADDEGIDKMSWIRRALTNFAGEEEDAMVDEAIEDYIALRIDENVLKDFTGMKTIPSDLKKAREEALHLIVNKRVKKK